MYRFQVSAHTNMGESIALLGSTAELGSWSISNCIPLQTKSDRYPLWWADVDIPYTDSKIEYKYLKFSAEGEVIWESLGNDNRWIPLEKEAKEATLIVEDGWFGHLQPYPYGYWEKPLIQNPPLKDKNGLRILVIGSSVAMGCSAWLLKGWAELLKETLAEKYGHQLINVSELGASVSTTIKRFESVVIPQKPDIVIIALSLGNEGFAYCQPHERKALQQRFESGLQRLIQMTKEIGAIPMLGSVYPHGEYSAEHNWFLYDTHSRMLSWDVPVLDWLTELNDGNGRFAEGLSFDVAHPNSEGHRVMFSAINVPIFDLNKEEAGKKKLSLKPIDVCLFDDQKGFKIAWREKNNSLLFTNNSKVDFQINPYRLELQDCLQNNQLLEKGIYLANTRRVANFSLWLGEKKTIDTIVNIPPSHALEYLPLSAFFSPDKSEVLFYDGSLGILKIDENNLYLINESEHEYNVQPMWKEVSEALRDMKQGVYDDLLHPDIPFRRMMLGETGLESRIKVPPKSALPFQYKCPLSELKRIAILPLGDRCAVRMLLHKIQYDGPAYPFDLTRTTNLSDVADIIDTGFEDMWNPEYLHYNDEHGRIYHSKWTGLSFAHEVENTDDPINDMTPVFKRMKKRYQGRSHRFWATIDKCDEVLFIRTGRADREQVIDIMGKLKEKCQGKTFRLLIMSEQDSQEFSDLEGVLHENIYYNPDWMYDNHDYWWECSQKMRSLLDSLGVTSKNLFWCTI
ncbi:DUF1796 family putative cysteine peptidase [Cyanobacterium aponinum UTEX 3222]|uniref:Lipase n=1 Tax=Cyanobacterium aponinum 0216 TaxID=2676140 RepID=A0A844GX04_9CHRO|nr:DUF1796 family putative cysteine peptidase [Cyanobacterium aponinum]MBD2393901.1 lipase [Cyanobacterium aponinum FACHB-4101]MTF39561.1 lipase [Cyanobacterium aponinum 0216]WRL43751.1 DUF1796 family putative cysteine peptidase [Cyanobacterium aponinum UTEX 3222]